MENCPRGTPRITPLALSKDLLALRSDAYTLTEVPWVDEMVGIWWRMDCKLGLNMVNLYELIVTIADPTKEKCWNPKEKERSWGEPQLLSSSPCEYSVHPKDSTIKFRQMYSQRSQPANFGAQCHSVTTRIYCMQTGAKGCMLDVGVSKNSVYQDIGGYRYNLYP